MTIKHIEVPDWIRSVLILDPTDIWGNVVGMGLAELTACLSIAKRFDRRGNVIFLDTFEEGLSKCYSSLAGTLASVALFRGEARQGAFSAKLTGGSTLGRYAQIYYRLPLPPLSKIGVECSVRIVDAVEEIGIDVSYWDGTNEHYAALKYLPVSNKWQYCNSAGTWSDLLTAVKLNEIANLFHAAKLVFDPEADKYVRALISGQEVDMSAYGSVLEPDATDPMLEVWFKVKSESGLNGVAYLDSIIVTINEPA